MSFHLQHNWEHLLYNTIVTLMHLWYLDQRYTQDAICNVNCNSAIQIICHKHDMQWQWHVDVIIKSTIWISYDVKTLTHVMTNTYILATITLHHITPSMCLNSLGVVSSLTCIPVYRIEFNRFEYWVAVLRPPSIVAPNFSRQFLIYVLMTTSYDMYLYWRFLVERSKWTHIIIQYNGSRHCPHAKIDGCNILEPNH